MIRKTFSALYEAHILENTSGKRNWKKNSIRVKINIHNSWVMFLTF
jgi:hypothetical protein